MKKIGIFSVGTGGHVIPARSIVEQLIESGISLEEFVIVTDARGSKYFKGLDIKLHIKDIYRSKNGIIGYVLNVYGIFKTLLEIKKIILDENIKIIFSTGSYIAPLASFLCLILNIRFISQEQNIYSGLGNKIASYFPGKIFTSFPETNNINKKKIEFVGPVINKKLFKENKKENKQLTIGIQGGSQGSLEINNYFSEFIRKKSFQDMNLNVRFVHITGDKHNLKDSHFVKEYEQYDFISDMNTFYQKIDLQISRSGGGAFEAAYLDIPQILIPYRHGTTSRHQTLNARYFESIGLAIIANTYLDFENHMFNIFRNQNDWKERYFKESEIITGNDKICNYLLEELNESI